MPSSQLELSLQLSISMWGLKYSVQSRDFRSSEATFATFWSYQSRWHTKSASKVSCLVSTLPMLLTLMATSTSGNS